MFTRKNRNSIPDMSQLFGHYPKPASEGSFPNGDTFLSKSLKKIFFRKKSYSPAGLFQITVFRRCDLRTQTWSDSASEDYASSSFPLQRASQSELSKLLFIPEQ